MFGYFKRRREKRRRLAEAKDLGERLGAGLRDDLDLYISTVVHPRREAFLNVFRGQLEGLDDNLVDAGVAGEISRLEAAGFEFRELLANWDRRLDDQLADAERALHEQIEVAAVVGEDDRYRELIQESLANQRLLLLSEALEVFLDLVPEARNDEIKGLT